MCGISGIIIKNNDYLSKICDYSNNLLKFLINRGPDQQDIYIKNNISLIHNRLSIIDLDERSKQPFTFKNLVMIFNGEIYNYIELKELLIENYNAEFISNSDTEVLIQLFYYYGLNKTLELLNGIFAISLYNIDTHEITIIRDRIGIKYCYYYEDENIFIYASNPAAIAKTLYNIDNIKFNINIESLFSYLSSGICLSNKSLFENINGINNGTYISINCNNHSKITKKWWYPNLNRSNEDLENIIENAVTIQERGDVNKNILFSGGIDSSIISYYSKECNFLSIPLGEEQHAKNIINNMNKNNLHLISNDFLNENLNYFIDEQRKIINFTGIPIKASYIMNISGLYINKHLKKDKILLTGIGGNELFYGHRRMKLNENGFKNHVRDLYLFLSQIKPLDNKYKSIFLDYKKDFAEKLKLSIDIPENLTNDNIPRWLEFKTFLLNDLLINADSIYMYYSIEARVPLLDHNIFEVSLSKNPKEFFYDSDKMTKNPTWNEYTRNSKKQLKDILLNKFDNNTVFKEKYSYDVERHKLHPLYIELCDSFFKRDIISWNGAITKYNSHLIGNIELWLQEFENIIII